MSRGREADSRASRRRKSPRRDQRESRVARLKVIGTPREWQTQALAEWKARQRRGIAHVVTGAGKTRFAELCIADFLNEYPRARVNILVPTLALLDQWYVDLREDLGVDADDVALFSGEQR